MQGSLLSEEHSLKKHVNKFIAEIINQFYQIYQDIGKRDFWNDYKERWLVFGKTINFKTRETRI